MMRSLLIAWIAARAALAASPAGDSVPLFFIANHGQGPPEVHFMAQGSGLTAYFSPEAALFRLADTSVRVRFVGARASVQIEGVEPLEAKASFLAGAEENWRLDVPLYTAVRYRGLYPGVDMIYGGNGHDLKSEFVVAPGVDPALIRLRYQGTGEARTDASGALVIPAGGHDLREAAPVIYQDRDGRRVPVEGRYALETGATVGFIVSHYDPSLPLIIDPVLSYSTLLGGSSSDAAMAIAVDAAGSAYVAGFTASYDFPTANPEQNFNAGGNDVFVAKLNVAGNGLVYCTYIGGRGDDRAYGIAVDGSGAAYVTGSTTSSNFPLKNAQQSKLAGAKNAFVLKLNAAGNSLVYSTYLGGNASDAGNGIAVDGSGNAYVVGDTTSVTFPATGLQKGNHGGMDAFVAKIGSTGTLSYSTYLGGSSDDHGAAIAVNTAGNAYITGSTWSADFPVAAAFQSKLAGGQDAFAAKLAADGSALLFSTFLGGSGGTLGYPEAGRGIALDSQGNAYLTGVTSSTDFPLLNPLESTLGGPMDAFVVKLTSTGTLSYSTYLGGSGVDAGNAIAVDANGDADVVGQTFSSDLPVINAPQAASGGDYDAFFAELSSTGGSLLFLSYLGGNGSDTATAVALDGSANLYIAGWTLSTNFPLVNAYQSTNGGNYGAFVTKVTPSGGPPATVSVTPASGSGSSQAFSMVYTDPRGYAAIISTEVLFNGSLATSSGCYLLYNRSANTISLTNDAGTVWQTALTLGQSGTLQNSQCSVSSLNSSASGSGNNLTLNLALTFLPAFSGTQNTWLEVSDAAGDSGWQQRGSWTVPASGPPATVSVTPASGSGNSQAFTFAFSDPKGYSTIVSTQIVINNILSTANGCYLLFYRSTNAIYLTNDAGTAWQNPVTLGQSGTLQNSQCSVNPLSSSASGSGNNLTVNLALTFQAAFGGAKNIYMEAYDGTSDSGWQQRGSWTVPSSGPPATVSVTPSSGSGSSQTFGFAFSDPAGYSAIVSAQLLINNPMTTSGGCYLLYSRSTNSLYLTNDAGTAWQTPVTLGQSGTLQNSQCSVNPLSSSASGSGNNLTVTLILTFQAAFGGTKNIYMEVYDGTGDSGWQQRGSWAVPSSGPPAAVSVTPASGSGSSQTFGFAFSDPAGYSTIVSAQLLINNPMTTSGGCYLLYYRPNNAIYLTNDAGTAWQTPVTLGQSGTLQNSQCSVNTLSSSASGSGNNLTVNLALTFKAGFSGTKNIYMEVYDGTGDSGWQQRGTWTTP